MSRPRIALQSAPPRARSLGSQSLGHYLGLILAMITLLLGLFALFEALDLEWLSSPERWLSAGGLLGGLLGIGLLGVDVLLPVPSSLVMVAHGAAFGVVVGTTLSIIGNLAAGWFGFGIGRRGGPLLARLVPAAERQRADALLARWGALAVILSRPVPIFAETVAVLAGTSPMSLRQMTLATLAGSLPASLTYALAGALAAQALDNFVLVFVAVLLVPAPIWLLARRWARRNPARTPETRESAQ